MVDAKGIKKTYDTQMQNVTYVVSKLKDKDSRKELLADEEMAPHLYMAFLLVIVTIMAIIIAAFA